MATDPAVDGVTGRYFEKCGPARTSDPARDPSAAARLWTVSAELCGLPDQGSSSTGRSGTSAAGVVTGPHGAARHRGVPEAVAVEQGDPAGPARVGDVSGWPRREQQAVCSHTRPPSRRPCPR